MENLCAILDIQGFYKNKKFVPREIAITSNSLMSMCFEVDPELSPESECFEDRVTNDFIRNRINGLAFKPRTDKFLSQKDVPALLRYFYETCKSDNAKYIGIKNTQLAIILKENKIPFIMLDTPKLERLDNYYGGEWVCHYHEDTEHVKCALRKVNYLKRWINEKDSVSKFINSVYSLF
jgi:hypothetical protein